ncbi:lysylphosphatidylglycerol synthase transmembrane domain-containing protein [Eupransor demetentiae]|uniref:Phosphatidylglycerol lysyltransferase n=1 Tax=Eupransor demetentiae TaxID=3109584 RepID=A0ABM9N2X4_9LACO|nr:Predicted membrane flippase AglD2/YbhN [Lactobacillaceae bacterium LMG 33000]
MSKRNWLSGGLVVILTAWVIYYLTNELKGKGHQLEAALKVLDWRWLATGFVLMLVSICFEAFATHALLDRADRKRLTPLALIKVPLMNLLGTGLTPFASGGQPAQLYALVSEKVEAGKAMSAILMKFLVYQVVVVLFFIVGYFAADDFIYKNVAPTFATFIPFAIAIHAFVIIGIAMVMFWPALTLKVMDWLAKAVGYFAGHDRYQSVFDKGKEKINNFHNESRRVVKNYRSLALATLYTTLQLIVFYLIPYFVIRSFGYAWVNPWLIVTMNIMIVMVISLFPIPGGVGGAELSFQLLFTPFVKNPVTLVLVILLWRLITYYFGLFAGIIAYIWPVKKES